MCVSGPSRSHDRGRLCNKRRAVEGAGGALGAAQPQGHQDKCIGTRPKLPVVCCKDGAVHVANPSFSCLCVASVQRAAVGMLYWWHTQGRWLAAVCCSSVNPFWLSPGRYGLTVLPWLRMMGRVAGRSRGLTQRCCFGAGGCSGQLCGVACGVGGVLQVCAPHQAWGMRGPLLLAGALNSGCCELQTARWPARETHQVAMHV